MFIAAPCSDDNPAVCSDCEKGMAPDPSTGVCVPCREIPNGRPGACSRADATRCRFSDHCLDGFFCHNVTGQCNACPGVGCSTCNETLPNDCEECLPRYWDSSQPLDAQRYRVRPFTDLSQRLPASCQPCADPNCLACQLSFGAACERCDDGYFLDASTKRCRPVGGALGRGPDGEAGVLAANFQTCLKRWQQHSIRGRKCVVFHAPSARSARSRMGQSTTHAGQRTPLPRAQRRLIEWAAGS